MSTYLVLVGSSYRHFEPRWVPPAPYLWVRDVVHEVTADSFEAARQMIVLPEGQMILAISRKLGLN